MVNDLFSYIDRHLGEYVDFLKKICSFEARATDKKEIDSMVEYISEFALQKGFLVERVPFDNCGDFLIIDINKNKEKGSMFLAHMDTVHQKGVFGYPCVRIEDGKLYGPGAIDCKGGIAIALLAMEALYKCGARNHTRLILTSDEEVSNTLGGEKEQQFFRDTVKGFKNALNCEGICKNEVIVSRKGILRYKIEIDGKGGHSGEAYFKSSSAVLEAAHKIIQLEKASKPGGSTYNCSVIRGGEVPNIIPDKCYFIVDIRVVNLGSIEKVKEFVLSVVNTSYVEGTTATVTKVSSRMPMENNEETKKLFNKLQEISIKNNLGELTPIKAGGGSDSTYTQMAGAPSLCGLGGSGDFCHTDKEYISLESISKRAKLLVAFCNEQEEK